MIWTFAFIQSIVYVIIDSQCKVDHQQSLPTETCRNLILHEKTKKNFVFIWKKTCLERNQQKKEPKKISKQLPAICFWKSCIYELILNTILVNAIKQNINKKNALTYIIPNLKLFKLHLWEWKVEQSAPRPLSRPRCSPA